MCECVGKLIELRHLTLRSAVIRIFRFMNSSYWVAFTTSLCMFIHLLLFVCECVCSAVHGQTQMNAR